MNILGRGKDVLAAGFGGILEEEKLKEKNKESKNPDRKEEASVQETDEGGQLKKEDQISNSIQATSPKPPTQELSGNCTHCRCAEKLQQKRN